jgi:hypothetical protein
MTRALEIVIRSTGTINITNLLRKITTRAGNHGLEEQLSCDDEKDKKSLDIIS